MRSRGRTDEGLPTALTAVIVGILATVAALTFYFRPEQQFQSPLDDGAVAAGAATLETASDADQETPAPAAIQISLTLDRSSTVERYLVASGLDPDEAKRWSEVFQDAARTRMMRSDHVLTIYKDPETSELRGIKYDVDERSSIVVASLGNMVLKSATVPVEYYVRPVELSFAVNDDFKRTATKQGVPQSIVDSLMEAFSERQGLDKPRPGTGVKLIYQEKISADGNYHLVGDVEAAEISFGDRTLRAFSFRDEHGRSHLYDDQGHALGTQYLRFPVKFTYVGDGFTMHRYHPILHMYRPHLGVDLVAQYGTPVKAVADGKVESAGWQGELGNCVRIEHGNGTTSIYGHLSRISPDTRANGYVKMGQVIGWVGSTGLSTGPHLHFAMEKQGNFVNPMTATLGVHHQVSPRMQALFQDIKAHYETALAKLPDLGNHFVPVEARKPAISPLADTYHVTLQKAAVRTSGHHRIHRHDAEVTTQDTPSSALDGAL